MNVARILYPVEVLGPGKRVGIWVCGCHRRCPGCSNSELWDRKPEYEVSISDIMRLINRIGESHEVDGFTISGGEPMNQPEDLSELIKYLIPISRDILVYSGYQLEELEERHETATDKILSEIAVLIDGEYIEEKNKGVLLKGSFNQRIHVLNPDFQEQYNNYLKTAHNQIQNFTTSNGVVSVGIHNTGF